MTPDRENQPTGNFTFSEKDKLKQLRTRFRSSQEFLDRKLTVARLDFARWLFQEGKLTEAEDLDNPEQIKRHFKENPYLSAHWMRYVLEPYTPQTGTAWEADITPIGSHTIQIARFHNSENVAILTLETKDKKESIKEVISIHMNKVDLVSPDHGTLTFYPQLHTDLDTAAETFLHLFFAADALRKKFQTQEYEEIQT